MQINWDIEANFIEQVPEFIAAIDTLGKALDRIAIECGGEVSALFLSLTTNVVREVEDANGKRYEPLMDNFQMPFRIRRDKITDLIDDKGRFQVVVTALVEAILKALVGRYAGLRRADFDKSATWLQIAVRDNFPKEPGSEPEPEKEQSPCLAVT